MSRVRVLMEAVIDAPNFAADDVVADREKALFSDAVNDVEHALGLGGTDGINIEKLSIISVVEDGKGGLSDRELLGLTQRLLAMVERSDGKLPIARLQANPDFGMLKNSIDAALGGNK